MFDLHTSLSSVRVNSLSLYYLPNAIQNYFPMFDVDLYNDLMVSTVHTFSSLFVSLFCQIEATNDLENFDKERHEDFKRYEMAKEHDRREHLKALDEEARKKEEEHNEELKKKHADHPKINHPVS